MAATTDQNFTHDNECFDLISSDKHSFCSELSSSSPLLLSIASQSSSELCSITKATEHSLSISVLLFANLPSVLSSALCLCLESL